MANKAAISHARDRLGPEPMALVFEQVAKPLAVEGTPGCWLAGRRLVAIDGTCLDLPDTPANEALFGRPGVMKGERSAFPQARLAALAECGTHAMFEAVITAYSTSENALSSELLTRLRPGCCAWPTAASSASRPGRRPVLPGRICCGGPRTTSSSRSSPTCPDGSWLAEVFDSVADRRRQRPSRVRVIEYTVEDGREWGSPGRR